MSTKAAYLAGLLDGRAIRLESGAIIYENRRDEVIHTLGAYLLEFEIEFIVPNHQMIRVESDQAEKLLVIVGPYLTRLGLR